MPRAPSTLQKWSRLQDRSFPLLTPSVYPSLLPAYTEHAPRQPNSRNLPHPRLLHTTPSCNAARRPARAPGTREKMRYERSRYIPVSSSQEPPAKLADSPQSTDDPIRTQLEHIGKGGWLLTDELLDGGIIKSHSPKKISAIAVAVIKGAEGFVTSKTLIAEIAQNEKVSVGTVFVIGQAAAKGNRKIFKWLVDSCVHAGVPMAIYISSANYLEIYQSRRDARGTKGFPELPLVFPLTLVKPLAIQSEGKKKGQVQSQSDPLAMLIWAKYLGLRKEYDEAIKLVKEVLQMIEPVRSKTELDRDLVQLKVIGSPWALPLWLAREQRGDRWDDLSNPKKPIVADQLEALRLGSVDYQDPEVSLRFAQYMGQTEGINAYEKYMAQAAAAGNKDACRKLANFYYLISMGEYPQCGTQAAKDYKLKDLEVATPRKSETRESSMRTGFFDRLASYFAPRPTNEYRSLAMEWYSVGRESSCLISGVNQTVLELQDLDNETAWGFLQDMQKQSTQDGEAHYNKYLQRILGEATPDQATSLKLRDLDL